MAMKFTKINARNLLETETLTTIKAGKGAGPSHLLFICEIPS